MPFFTCQEVSDKPGLVGVGLAGAPDTGTRDTCGIGLGDACVDCQ